MITSFPGVQTGRSVESIGSVEAQPNVDVRSGGGGRRASRRPVLLRVVSEARSKRQKARVRTAWSTGGAPASAPRVPPGHAPSRDDDVALDGIDLHAPVLEPPDAPLERALVALELERDPPVVGLHDGAPDVDDEVEVLDEAIHDRLLDQLRGKRQPQAYARHREHQLNGPRRWRERSRPDRRP